MITIIVPIRLSKNRLYDEITRLRRIANAVPKDKFQILLIDYGTGFERRHELEEVAEAFINIDLFRVEAENLPFSIGRSRDIGVQQASTDVVMFQDIDFICSTENYNRLYEEIEIRDMKNCGYDFFCVPTIFLTQFGTNFYLNLYERNRAYHADQIIHDYALKGRNQFFHHTALGSSATVINRYYYLTTGGHDPSFVGHGAEDFEFYHRLALETPRSGRPKNYYENITKFDGNYAGFRAFFALYGADVWMRGIAFVHLEHPRRELTDESYRKSAQNFALLNRRMTEADRNELVSFPLPDPKSDHFTLVLADSTSSPGKAIRQCLPALGEYEFLPEALFENSDVFIETLRKRGFTQVFFLNPYGNNHRRKLYETTKSNGIPFITFDRGALPDSWFFDRGGFLNESISYSNSNWNKPLNCNQESRIANWIEAFRNSDATLEENGDQQSEEYWRNQLNLGRRRVIFVALQRPNDTATVFFSGSVQSVDGFIDWIRYLVKSVNPAETVILIKKHPLEDFQPDIDGVVFAPGSAHVHDLIELSDKVVVINSGVGLLSLIFEKPVITCGDAFYAQEGLAYSAKTREDLVKLIDSELVLEKETLQQFLYYLVFEFYSFGCSKYNNSRDSSGARIKIASEIQFSWIRNLLSTPISLGEMPNQVPLKSYLMQISGARKEPNKPVVGFSQKTNDSESANYQELYDRGCSAFHGGSFECAVEQYTKAVKLEPENANVRRVLAESLIKMGRRKDAIIHLKRACELRPENRAIMRRLNDVRIPFYSIISRNRPFPVPKGWS